MLTVVASQDAGKSTGQVGGSLLDEIVRDGARRMLAAALQVEVAAYIDAHADQVDEFGHRLAETLAPHGWNYVPPELDARHWRRFFVHVTEHRRTRHLHLLISGSPRWREQLAFRDALRADATLATRYGQLKRALAAEHPDDREAYTQGKADLVRAALDEASPPEHP